MNDRDIRRERREIELLRQVADVLDVYVRETDGWTVEQHIAGIAEQREKLNDREKALNESVKK